MYLMSTIMFSVRASATVAWSVPMPVSLTGEHNNLFDLAIETHYIRMVYLFPVKSETEKSVYESYKNIEIWLRFHSDIECYYHTPVYTICFNFWPQQLWQFWAKQQ